MAEQWEFVISNCLEEQILVMPKREEPGWFKVFEDERGRAQANLRSGFDSRVSVLFWVFQQFEQKGVEVAEYSSAFLRQFDTVLSSPSPKSVCN